MTPYIEPITEVTRGQSSDEMDAAGADLPMQDIAAGIFSPRHSSFWSCNNVDGKPNTPRLVPINKVLFYPIEFMETHSPEGAEKGDAVYWYDESDGCEDEWSVYHG